MPLATVSKYLYNSHLSISTPYSWTLSLPVTRRVKFRAIDQDGGPSLTPPTYPRAAFPSSWPALGEKYLLTQACYRKPLCPSDHKASSPSRKPPFLFHMQRSRIYHRKKKKSLRQAKRTKAAQERIFGREAQDELSQGPRLSALSLGRGP